MSVAIAKKPAEHPTPRKSFDPADEQLKELLTEWKGRSGNPELQKLTNVKIREYAKQVYPSFEVRALITTHQKGLNPGQMVIFNQQTNQLTKPISKETLN